jgi:hypothetical protein
MTNEEASEAAGDQSPPAATLERVALELGTAIDDSVGHEKKQRPSMLHSAPRFPDIEAKSEVHGRCRWREDLVIGSMLLDPRQRDDDRWPYRHFFLGSLSPVNLSANANLEALRDNEAVAYYGARARTTKHSYLAFRYHDFAGLFSKGRDRLNAWSAAIDAGIAAFNEWAPVAHAKHRASDILLRALEIAAILNSADLTNKVCAVIVPYIDAHLLTDPRIPTDLIHGYAKILPRGIHLNLADIADRLESAAEQIASGTSQPSGVLKQVGSPFGPVWGVAECTKDNERIDRVIRRHAESLIAHAEALAKGTGERSHVHHWYGEAWKALSSTSSCADLKEKVRKGLQDSGARLREDLKPQVFEEELSPEAIAELKESVREMVAAGQDWPAVAARMIFFRTPTEAEAKAILERDRVEFPLAHLFAQTRIEDDRPVTTDSADWKHKVELYVRLSILGTIWPNAIVRALKQLNEDGHVTTDALIQPFVERGFSTDLIRAAVSAAYCMTSGDHVGATQLWCLYLERTLRFVIGACGGSTTAVDRDGRGEREAVFDSAVEAFCKLLEQKNVDVASRTRNLLCAFMSWRGFGYNWRNRIAHGTMPAAEMGPFSSYISYLLCVLVGTFLVGRVVEENQDASVTQTATSPDASSSTGHTGSPAS